MTDREMLEFAAKAGGINVLRSRLEDPMFRDMLVSNGHRNPHHENGPWNPLTDDGDALRLAVKLSQSKPLRLMFPEKGDEWAVVDDYGFEFKIREFDKDDPYAATRRAIVRAAAEIGRKLND